MTIGRFATDPLSHRYGSASVVGASSAVAATGMIIVATAPTAWLTSAGWVLFGLDVAGSAGQVFAAAGRVAHHSPA